MGTNIFYSQKLNDEQLDRVDVVRQTFSQLFDYLDDLIPTRREKSLYKTKLEEASMWAVKAISFEEEVNQ